VVALVAYRCGKAAAKKSLERWNAPSRLFDGAGLQGDDIPLPQPDGMLPSTNNPLSLAAGRSLTTFPLARANAARLRPNQAAAEL